MPSRSASLPPGCAGGGAVNPFWSERLKAEAGLRRMRPADLPPVPGGEDDLDLARESESEKIPMEDGTSSRVRKMEERGRSHEPAPGRFSTPASWSGVREDHGGLKTEGEMPSGPQEMDSEIADGLQRELEKEVVQQLHVENQRLRMELEKLQSGKRSQETPSSWSAVTPETVPAPPRSRSPVRMQLGEKSALRFTPGGTQVPEGRPPDDDPPAPPVLPEWPAFLRDYEVCSSVGPCAGRMGPSTVGLPSGSRKSFLHDRVCRGGVDPRQLYDEVYGGGVYPRRLHDQEYGRGARSRYEEGLVQDRVEKEMESMNLKAKWLEEELALFKRALESEPQARASRCCHGMTATGGLLFIGMVGRVIKNVMEIGPRALIKNVMVIGLTACIENVMVIGLTACIENVMVIGLTACIENVMVIGLRAFIKNVMVIGLRAFLKNVNVIGLRAHITNVQVIGLMAAV